MNLSTELLERGAYFLIIIVSIMVILRFWVLESFKNNPLKRIKMLEERVNSLEMDVFLLKLESDKKDKKEKKHKKDKNETTGHR